MILMSAYLFKRFFVICNKLRVVGVNLEYKKMGHPSIFAALGCVLGGIL